MIEGNSSTESVCRRFALAHPTHFLKRIRFGIRSTLVAFLIVAVILTWMQSSGFQQYLAVRQVKELGGELIYAHELPDNSPPWFPELFGQIYSLDLGSLFITTATTDQQLAEIIVAMPELRRLHLVGTSVSDDSIDSLKSLGQLEYICVASTNVTEAGLQRLESHLPNFECTFQVIEGVELPEIPYRDPLENYYLDLIAE